MVTPIYSDPVQTSRLRLATEFPTSIGNSAAAQAQDAWVRSPLSSIFRSVELESLQGEEYTPLTDEEAAQRIRESNVGLTVPKGGVTSEALDMLIRLKKEENLRMEKIARAPGGFLSTAAVFGAGVAGSIIDPINIAASFIPVIGQARYARMIAAQSSVLGRTAVRAGAGAVEGAFGAALVEPIVLTAAQREQADYDISDSVLNVAFGTVMGGGLHMGAGAYLDAINAKRPTIEPQGSAPKMINDLPESVRETMGRGAVAQMAAGKNVDVSVVGEFTPVRSATRQVLENEMPMRVDEPDVERIARGMDPGLYDNIKRLETEQESYRRWIDEIKKDEISGRVSAVDQQITELEAKKEGQSAKNRKKTQQRIDALKEERAAFERNSRAVETADTKKLRQKLVEADEKLRDLATERTELYRRAKEQAASGELVLTPEPARFRLETYFERDPSPTAANDIQKSIEAAYSPRNTTVADFDASAEIDAMLKEAPAEDLAVRMESEIADLTDELNAAAERTGRDDLRDFTEVDDMVARSEEYGKAMQAYALCKAGK